MSKTPFELSWWESRLQRASHQYRQQVQAVEWVLGEEEERESEIVWCYDPFQFSSHMIERPYISMVSLFYNVRARDTIDGNDCSLLISQWSSGD